MLKEEIIDIIEHVKSAKPAVTLLAASKTQPSETIETLIKAGISSFGENRVQEAEAKWPDLKRRYSDIELHLIGPLQTNKVKAALSLFDVIQTVDRPKLAQMLSAELKVQNEKKSPQFYIQVNTGEEPQKGGVMPQEADRFIEYCIKDLKLPVTGLMCIPPTDQPPAPHFALLKKIAARHGLTELSMGMSADYKEAIRMGSTLVRIGSALFGNRQ